MHYCEIIGEGLVFDDALLRMECLLRRKQKKKKKKKSSSNIMEHTINHKSKSKIIRDPSAR